MEDYTEGELKLAESQIAKLVDPCGHGFDSDRHIYTVARDVQCHLNRANELLRIVKNATFTPSRLFKVVSEYLDT